MPVHNTKTALYITAPQTSVEDLACVILQAHIRLHCEYNYHCSSHIEVMDNEAVSAFKAEVHCTSNWPMLPGFQNSTLPTSVHFLKLTLHMYTPQSDVFVKPYNFHCYADSPTQMSHTVYSPWHTFQTQEGWRGGDRGQQ